MIYLDGHSTTPLDPQVFEAMRPYFFERFGNASQGLHRMNWEAQAGVSRARAQVAEALRAHDSEIVFTGSATEANHLALLGLEAWMRKEGRTRILSLEIEHSSVLGPLEILSERGFDVEWIPTDRFGRVNLGELDALLDSRVGLVSVALANHEVGTIQALEAIAEKVHAIGAILHSDAVQAFGRIPFTVNSLGVDLMTLSAHKVHGPKGAGALYVRRKGPRVELEPFMRGGGQERGLRPGTPNTPALVGMGEAAERAQKLLSTESERLKKLRDLLWSELQASLPCLIRNSPENGVLPHNLNISVQGVDGAALFGRLTGVAVSNASACLNGTQDYSQVLSVLGVPRDLARASLRFGLGRFTGEDEIRAAAGEIIRVVKDLRRMEREFAEQTGTPILGGCGS